MEGNLQGKETSNYLCNDTVYVSCYKNTFSSVLYELPHGTEKRHTYQLTLWREQNKNAAF